MVKIKVCGITNQDEAEGAVTAGVDALGFVFSKSPRQVLAKKVATIIQRLPPFITAVGVFVNEDRDRVLETAAIAGITTLQFHGDEPPHYLDYFRGHFGFQVIKAIRIESTQYLKYAKKYKPSAFLLFDAYSPRAYGGLGEPFDWNIIRENSPSYPFILAGGLNSQNIKRALDMIKPYGVDVSSGVETDGGKDTGKIKELVQIMRRWEKNAL